MFLYLLKVCFNIGDFKRLKCLNYVKSINTAILFFLKRQELRRTFVLPTADLKIKLARTNLDDNNGEKRYVCHFFSKCCLTYIVDVSPASEAYKATQPQHGPNKPIVPILDNPSFPAPLFPKTVFLTVNI